MSYAKSNNMVKVEQINDNNKTAPSIKFDTLILFQNYCFCNDIILYINNVYQLKPLISF